MEIVKIINNNIAMVTHEGNEVIVMGRGIAFNKRIGSQIEEYEVDKVYHLSSKELNSRFQDLIAKIPIEQIETVNKIIEEAKVQLGKKISDSIYISLIDHINFAIQRFSEGVCLRNPLLWEIMKLYPEEYKIGASALAAINEKFKIDMPEDEAGFIALHFVNAQLEDGSEDIYKETRIIQDILNIIRYHFKVEINSSTLNFYRLVTHLRYFSHRIVNNSQVTQKSQDEELFSIIKSKYANSYQCVQKITKLILLEYKYEVRSEEEMYLTIHIQRAAVE